MFQKCWRSFVYTMGIVAIILTVISLFFPNAIRSSTWHFAVCTLIPVHCFSFFTFELKLFSRYIWIRRTIVIFFSVFFMITASILFDHLKLEFNRLLIVYGIAALCVIVISVFFYYVGDKIEEKNLKAINQKLADKNTENDK